MGKWVVLKYGGTSVSEVHTWSNIVHHVDKLLASDPELNVWVVVSALSKITNALESCVKEIGNYKQHLNYILDRHYDLAKRIVAASDGKYNKKTEASSDLSEIINEDVEELISSLGKLLEGIELTGDNASSKLLGRVFSYGELLSSRLGNNILNHSLQNGQCVWVDAREFLTAVDRPNVSQEDKFLNAYVQPKIDVEFAESKVTEFVVKGNFKERPRVVITQGFIAATGKARNTCALGRGGGDVSGALFACLLNAIRFEVWTDVHGLFTSDPRHVKNARHILELSYREAQELAAMGAKVLHPRSLAPAAFAKVPVQVHNTMVSIEKGSDKLCTRIVSPDDLQDKQTTVMAIARRLDQVLITLTNIEMWGASGFLSSAFEPFDRFNVSVDLIATSQYAVSLTLDYIPGGTEGDTFDELVKELKKVAQVDVHKKCAVVSIVGRRLRSVLHHMADAFKELAQYNVLMLSESTEDLNLSFVVDQSQDESNEKLDALVSSLHKVLLEDKRGLPSSASGSLFGSTLSQLMKAATTPLLSSLRPHIDVLTEVPKFNLPAVSEIKVGSASERFEHALPLDKNYISKKFSAYSPCLLLDMDSSARLQQIPVSLLHDQASQKYFKIINAGTGTATSLDQLSQLDKEILGQSVKLIATVSAIDLNENKILINVTADVDDTAASAAPNINASNLSRTGSEFAGFSIFVNNNKNAFGPAIILGECQISSDVSVGDVLLIEGARLLPSASTKVFII